jgi:SET domain-containing protein
MKIIIKDSKIEGKGAFANHDFKIGEVIIDWNDCSEILSEEQFKQLTKNEKRYVSFINKKYIHFFEPARYVNHSCNPNTTTKNNCDIAIKNIKKGEEITTNYLKEVPELNMKCNCGSKNCKGVIK